MELFPNNNILKSFFLYILFYLSALLRLKDYNTFLVFENLFFIFYRIFNSYLKNKKSRIFFLGHNFNYNIKKQFLVFFFLFNKIIIWINLKTF